MNASPVRVSHRATRSAVLTAGLISFACTGICAPAEELSFNRDIRPILSDKCFRCHGPDAAALKGDLRLDSREDVLRERDGYQVIVPGHPERSNLVERVTHVDEDEVMPPRDSTSELSGGEIAILKRWISEGARYEKHWSLVPPQRSPDSDLDSFVSKHLKKNGMSLSPEASKETLIRRLSLDLTGLPPSIQEVDVFLADHSPEAYERLVDRLLDSPRFGERMAVHWLDAARYADTNGYFGDKERTMWPWRDWVINAFNGNMPFDQFTIEQLAGDLLPDATQSQLIASGFNRNHMTNNETGIEDEEFRIEYVADRVKTTSTVWMGLTVECARCHDHKYDPISQKDYYRFFAFFNHIPERGLATGSGGSPPLLKVPSPGQIAEKEQLKQTLKKEEEIFRPVATALEHAQNEWEKSAVKNLPEVSTDGLVAKLSFDGDDSVSPAKTARGRIGNAVMLDGNESLAIPGVPRLTRENPFSVAAWIYTEERSPGCVVSKIDDTTGFEGFDLVVRQGIVMANFDSGKPEDGILSVAAKEKLPIKQWHHLLLTHDGSGKAGGVKIYINGKPSAMEVVDDSLKGDFATNEPFRVGGRKASALFKGRIDEVRFYDRKLEGDEALSVAETQFLRGVLSMTANDRSKSESKGLREHFLSTGATDAQQAAVRNIESLRTQVTDHEASIPNVMVMKEKEGEAIAHVLERGEYNQPGEKVTAGIPTVFGDIEKTDSLNRLDLAGWFVSQGNPLTARVIVNRFWLQLFGTGIVSTSEDFGTQGEWPSHPELLDWLACEFIENGWDVKDLLRTIVTSKTYRQQSGGSPEDFSRDPNNRLLARGPRFRMEAEMIRDSALLIGGLLHEKIGGASVKPYQPPGLWKEVSYGGELVYEPDEGTGRHRRSLYSYWKRQVPPPSMLLFDAPTRETCTVGRTLTNTPLQALVLMNDPAFLEAARGLAERVLKAANLSGDEAKIIHAFRTATARAPSKTETATLLKVHAQVSKTYRDDPDAAGTLLGTDKTEKPGSSSATAELAAWTATANVILSMDETITKF